MILAVHTVVRYRCPNCGINGKSGKQWPRFQEAMRAFPCSCGEYRTQRPTGKVEVRFMMCS